MDATSITRWIGAGLLGLPLYGALTFWSSMNPQPDPDTRYEAWARFVTTDHYVLTHVFGSILGIVFAIFGTFALGAYLASGRAGRMGLIAAILTVTGSTLFLTIGGVSTFAVPEEGQAYLAGIEGFDGLPTSLADNALAATFALSVLLIFAGNTLLGVAVWLSGRLPRWAGALWTAAAVSMYPLSAAVIAVTGAQSTPPTVLAGALMVVAGGAWMAWSVLRQHSAANVGVHPARPSAQ